MAHVVLQAEEADCVKALVQVGELLDGVYANGVLAVGIYAEDPLVVARPALFFEYLIVSEFYSSLPLTFGRFFVGRGRGRSMCGMDWFCIFNMGSRFSV